MNKQRIISVCLTLAMLVGMIAVSGAIPTVTAGTVREVWWDPVGGSDTEYQGLEEGKPKQSLQAAISVADYYNCTVVRMCGSDNIYEQDIAADAFSTVGISWDQMITIEWTRNTWVKGRAFSFGGPVTINNLNINGDKASTRTWNIYANGHKLVLNNAHISKDHNVYIHGAPMYNHSGTECDITVKNCTVSSSDHIPIAGIYGVKQTISANTTIDSDINITVDNSTVTEVAAVSKDASALTTVNGNVKINLKNNATVKTLFTAQQYNSVTSGTKCSLTKPLTLTVTGGSKITDNVFLGLQHTGTNKGNNLSMLYNNVDVTVDGKGSSIAQFKTQTYYNAPLINGHFSVAYTNGASNQTQYSGDTSTTVTKGFKLSSYGYISEDANGGRIDGGQYIFVGSGEWLTAYAANPNTDTLSFYFDSYETPSASVTLGAADGDNIRMGTSSVYVRPGYYDVKDSDRTIKLTMTGLFTAQDPYYNLKSENNLHFNFGSLGAKEEYTTNGIDLKFYRFVANDTDYLSQTPLASYKLLRKINKDEKGQIYESLDTSGQRDILASDLLNWESDTYIALAVGGGTTELGREKFKLYNITTNEENRSDYSGKHETFWILGAQVRTPSASKESGPALRFIADVNMYVMDEEGLSYDGDHRGVLIMPKKALPNENENALNKETTNVVDIPGTNMYRQDYTRLMYTGCLTGIPKEAKWYNAEFTARAYLRCTNGDGEVAYIYSEPYTTTYAKIAKATYDQIKGNPNYTEEDINYLKGICTTAGISVDG